MSAPSSPYWTEYGALRRYAWQRVAQRIAQRPFTFLGSLIAATAVLLPALLCALIAQQPWPAQMTLAPELSVFVSLDTRSTALKALTRKLEQLDAAREVKLLPRDEAFNKLLASPIAEAGLTKTQPFKTNPLPDVLIVQLRSDVGADDVTALARQIRKWEDVDAVVADTEWYRKWLHWRTLGVGALYVVSTIAALLLLWVMVVAVRLQAAADRDEVEVLDLVGADPAFVRRPFIYLGTLTLSLAMALALAVAHTLIENALPSVTALLNQYNLEVSLYSPSWIVFFLLITGAALAGGLIAGLGMRLVPFSRANS